MNSILYTNTPRTGTITVTKTITDHPEDMTVFRCTITGQSAYPTIVGPFDLSQEAPAICKDLPFDTYVVTEEIQTGHTQTSVHDPIILTRATRNQSVTVVNEITAQALELTWDNIANVPVANASSVSDWNTLFSTNGWAIGNFTSVDVIDNMTKLIGGHDINLTGAVCSYANFGDPNHILRVDDKTGCITNLQVFALDFCGNLEYVSLPSVLIAESQSLSNSPLLKTAILTSAISIGGGVFWGDNSLEYVDLSSIVTFGDMSHGEGRVFQDVSGTTITLKIPAHFMTDNGGLPHEEIQYLQASNTVTIITV